MNQTFSLTRFARLNRWFWALKGRTYSLAAVALLVITVLILSQVLAYETRFDTAILTSHIVYFNILALLLAGSIGSDVYSALYRQESAISYLMIPASRGEKFWLGVLYSVMAVVLFSIVFWGYESLIFSIANSRLPASQTERYVPTLLYYSTPTHNEKGILLMLAYAIFLGLAIAWLGSFYFRRGVFVRNVGVAIICAVVLVLLYFWIMMSQFGGHEVNSTLPFLSVNVHDINGYETLMPPGWLTYLAYGGTLMAMWVIARIRFNELER
ncbi:hypothetical protein [Fibrella aquatilis]|uniref:ABC-2 family transporter protein n=1 Tax=Fibrella aquatilis TaxID=2817059 RepID=A0A939G998_9BACT|nr:hypothetical protein [Fibrella aquatilis]MBO0934812.1 hypothetical protein [Fibrella aquatilis]